MAGKTQFKQETADIICNRLCEGESLRKICADDGMPACSTVFKWLAERAEFSEQYARAREVQADVLVDEIINIADDATNDWMERHSDDGNRAWVLNGEHVQRSKLRIEARKWTAGQLRPKKYGNKLDVAHSGNPIQITFASKDKDLL